MAGPAGGSIEAFRARQAGLSERHRAAAVADRALVEALAAAHAATAEGTRRLDAIAADIDRAVGGQVTPALDTAMGAREFQKFLLAKQQEITEVVSQARQAAAATEATLRSLRASYTEPAQD